MTKNILIFSDGTGQAGGLRPDQRLSNIYKLYRAMRPGPDSPRIDPSAQVAFYDPGLGTVSDTKGIRLTALQRLMAVFGQATGMGIMDNIIDCYVALLKHHRPGDRICVFGFSRGAYTARCVANVIRLCGVPTSDGKGGALPTDGPVLRSIAREAVAVYMNRFLNTNPKRVSAEEPEAVAFRSKYGAHGAEPEISNAAAAFVGVFDTVAALGMRGWRLVFFIVGLALAVGLISVPMGLVLRALFHPWLTFGVGVLAAFVTIGTTLGVMLYQNRWKLKDYDRSLDPLTGYARHACAIDESRADFNVLGWGHSSDVGEQTREHGTWFVQMWFSGNHSDIGGSYPEDESRLSDTALGWMLKELRVCVPEISVEDERLTIWGCPEGLQHCEVQSSRERTGLLKLVPPWPSRARNIHPDAKLHPTVLARFSACAVPQCRQWAPYRPDVLRSHNAVLTYFAK